MNPDRIWRNRLDALLGGLFSGALHGHVFFDKFVKCLFPAHASFTIFNKGMCHK
jgi:hypothetical protein